MGLPALQARLCEMVVAEKSGWKGFHIFWEAFQVAYIQSSFVYRHWCYFSLASWLMLTWNKILLAPLFNRGSPQLYCALWTFINFESHFSFQIWGYSIAFVLVYAINHNYKLDVNKKSVVYNFILTCSKWHFNQYSQYSWHWLYCGIMHSSRVGKSTTKLFLRVKVSC